MNTTLYNQIIKVSHYGTLLEFCLENDGRIYLLYSGRIRNNLPISKLKRKYRTIVEADIAEDNRNSHHGFRMIQSSYGETYKYVSHRENKTNSGYEFVLKTQNEYLEVESHFVFYEGCVGYSCFNVVRNLSASPVTLTSISSALNMHIGKSKNLKDYDLYVCHNTWHNEAQWRKSNFFEAGLLVGNGYLSNQRLSINNTGSWSTKEFLPMMGIYDKRNKEMTLVQIENNGSWHLEIGYMVDSFYYYGSGPEFNDNFWKKKLNYGESFESCHATVCFADDFEDVIGEITKIRRKTVDLT